MPMDEAKAKLSEAVLAVKKTQIGLGRGPGASEAALAATKAEEAEMWLQRAEERKAAGEDGEG